MMLMRKLKWAALASTFVFSSAVVAAEVTGAGASFPAPIYAKLSLIHI